MESYIDFEIEQEDFGNVRNLYERLLERTQHMKVWLSFTKFEASLKSDQGNTNARSIYKRADKVLRNAENNEERAIFLESWRDFERENGDEDSIEKVQKKMPRRVKKKRKVYREDGSDAGWEEYWDYIFPDDAAAAPSLKLLQFAHMWRKNEVPVGDVSSSESEGENEAEEVKDDHDTDYSDSSSDD